MRFLLAVCLLALIQRGALRAEEDLTSSKPQWQPYGEELDVLQMVVPSSRLFSSELTLVRTGLGKYRISVIRAAEFSKSRASVNALCKLSSAVLCINANFFDEKGEPLGLVISKGVTYKKLHQGGKVLTGIFEAGRNSMRIVSRSNYSRNAALEAVQAGPRLISNGRAIEGLHDDGRSRRSGICIDSSNRLITYAVSSNLVGVSIKELQDALLASPVECVDALNLDGGGSSQLYLNKDLPGAADDAIEVFIRGKDEVPVALGIFAKD